ncbi:MAG: hypothetical protein ACJAU7_001536 [Parvibaculaceae bacterium]|jgi:hypothetical protein
MYSQRLPSKGIPHLKRPYKFLTLSLALPALFFMAPLGVQAEDTSTAPPTLTEQPVAETQEILNDTNLETIYVVSPTVFQKLGGDSGADTGTSHLSQENFQARVDGSGDANSFLRSMPNVQYIDDTNDDAGEDGQDVINLRPREFSISGAGFDENNIMLNGVTINTITGSTEKSAAILDSDENTPNADLVYGLHSQAIFVPSAFVNTVTLTDSNASSEYGEFQGGVVEYELIKPPKDGIIASVDVSFQNDEMVNYKLGTEDGDNPKNRQAPTFTKWKKAASFGAPLTDKTSFLFAVSQQNAKTAKQKDYEFFDAWAHEESENIFLHGSFTYESEIGQWTFETSYTDYYQDFESVSWLDMELDIASYGITNQLRHEASVETLEILGLQIQDIQMQSIAYYNDNYTTNNSNAQIAYSYTKRESDGWVDPSIDWCQEDGTSTTCRRGGFGDKEQGQTAVGLKSKVTGELLGGNFKVGGEVRNIEATRKRDDFTYYTATETIGDAEDDPWFLATGFTCLDANDPHCSQYQYADIYAQWDAFNTTVHLFSLNGYAEWEQKWDWFDIRAGLRIDYADYLENINIAPRVVGTITPWSWADFSLGYNRYYNANELVYAIRDNQPRGQSFARVHDAVGNVTNSWTMKTDTGEYNYKQSSVSTPYTDEITASLKVEEPVLGGQIRLRAIDRNSRDQFTRSGSTTNATLTNGGSSSYRSLTAEYVNEWTETEVKNLDKVSVALSATYSESSMDSDNYFDDDFFEDLIFYDGKSYTPASFSLVTGNLDIPVRVNMSIGTQWLNNALSVDLSTDLNMPYRGVIDSDNNITFEGRNHDVWIDKDYGATLYTDMSAKYTFAPSGYGNFYGKMKVTNIFDAIGNRVANDDRPYIRGRAFWLSVGASF